MELFLKFADFSTGYSTFFNALYDAVVNVTDSQWRGADLIPAQVTEAVKFNN